MIIIFCHYNSLFSIARFFVISVVGFGGVVAFYGIAISGTGPTPLLCLSPRDVL